MRKLLTLLVSLLAIAAPASAQITTPFTFTAGTVANPDEVNSNFAKFADALNRTGGTMTGTLTSQQITPSASNTYDLGSAAALFRSGYLRTSLVFGQAAGNYTLTWANPAAARAISIADPGGTDVFTFNAATQTLTNKTLTAPVLSGTVTGTYTLGGTPTIPAGNLTGTITSATQDLITRTGTVTSGTWSASFGAVSGANLTSLTAGNLTGTITSATQDLITRTGTITSGTWQGTKIGLLYGGTNLDMTATGGTSQFLRQNTLGGAITVVRPAAADLSDASNLALLNATTAANSFTNGTRSPSTCDNSGVSCLSLNSTIVSLSANSVTMLSNTNGKVALATGGGDLDIGFIVNTSISANTNDWAPGAGSIVRVSATGAGFAITGIARPGIGTGGRFIWLANLGSNAITLTNSSASSLAGNRFLCPGNVDYSITQFKSVLLYYSTTDTAWLVLGGS